MADFSDTVRYSVVDLIPILVVPLLLPSFARMPQLVRACDAFDPEVPELPALLPESRFPEGVFRLPDVLVALRPLGLQSTLGWSGLVEAAASVEPMLRGWGNTERAVRVDDGNGSREAAAAAARGRALLTYLDTHEVRLFDLKREATGLLQRMAKLVLVDAAAAAREKERLAAIQHLMSLQWVSLEPTRSKWTPVRSCA